MHIKACVERCCDCRRGRIRCPKLGTEPKWRKRDGNARPEPRWGRRLTPYSGGGYPAPATAAPLPAPTSAMPPAQHAARHAKAMHAHHKAQKATLAGDTTAQLNREELARIQSGDPSAPPPPAPMLAAPMGVAPMPPQPNVSGEQHGNARSEPGWTRFDAQHPLIAYGGPPGGGSECLSTV
jgi:hypothetical protein